MRRGRGVRRLILGVAGLALLCVASCSKQEPVIARIEGSEPQRLSFGAPKDIQKAFLDKMQQCWMNGPDGVLKGGRVEAAPGILDTGDAPQELELITIYPSGGRTDQSFTVEFHRFNDNTLIATRNRGFPPQLAAILKRDVENWMVERKGCDNSDDPDLDLKGSPGSTTGQPQRWGSSG